MKFLPLLLLCVTGCVHNREYNSPQEEMKAESKSDKITNLQTVEEGLLRSGRLTAPNIRFLSESRNLKTIVSLETYWSASEVERSEVDTAKELGIKFIHIPMLPMGDVKKKDVWRAVDILANEQRPLILHCYRGSERTGLVIAGYRVKYEKWSYDRAVAEMDKYGFNPMFNEWKRILKEIK